jgi:hypothetical protein
MKLSFICQEGFKLAEEICHRIQGYLPNLVHDIEIIRTRTAISFKRGT